MNITMTTDSDGWRVYMAGKTPLFSITTILGNTVAKPKLNSWYKKNTAKKIEEVMTTTADIGTRAHAAFEAILKNEVPEVASDIQPLVTSFRKWKDDNNVKALHLEKTVFSKKYGYAGTLDFLGYVRGELTIIDWKTSTSYSVTNGWQMGAQRLAALESLNISKDCGVMGIQISRGAGKLMEFNFIKGSTDKIIDGINYICIDNIENSFLHTLENFKRLYRSKLEKLEWPWLHQKAFVRNPNIQPLEIGE